MPIDDEDVAQNFLCFRCVGESYFSAEIRAKGIVDDCSYCGQSAESYRISEVADRIENVFDEHFFRTSNEPDSWQYTLMNDSESTYNWEREGEEVTDAIMNAADMPEEAAEDAQSILQDKHSNFDSDAMGEETPFSCDSYYSEKGANDRAWQEDWRTFEMQLKTEARFFSRTAAKHLDSVFRGIETFSTRSGGHSVVEWGPSTSFNYLYRARVFQSPSQLDEALNRPDLHLGPPPACLAAAGRRNARGISVFYGASDPLVAVAEVRPPVGSQVAVARFEIRRSLRLL